MSYTCKLPDDSADMPDAGGTRQPSWRTMRWPSQLND